MYISLYRDVCIPNYFHIWRILLIAKHLHGKKSFDLVRKGSEIFLKQKMCDSQSPEMRVFIFGQGEKDQRVNFLIVMYINFKH